ncbi:hypothetical protein PO124_14135 [Bacillus licheniformis]|nr:hypothetical protein [Bacillus licheniformis]
MGFDSIARELLEEGLPTPSMVAGKRNASPLWHGSGVRIILETHTTSVISYNKERHQ